MAKQAIDFTRVHSKSYKVWRILQAPGVWGQIYRERDQALMNFKSAIIFPEQLLALNQSNLFTCGLSTNDITRSATVGSMPASNLILSNSDVSSFQEIYDWEYENDNQASISQMRVGIGYSSVEFNKSILFSNKKDAVKLATRHLEKF